MWDPAKDAALQGPKSSAAREATIHLRQPGIDYGDYIGKRKERDLQEGR